MPFLADTVYDNGLVQLLQTETLYINTAEQTTFAGASSGATRLGTKATPVVGSPADRSGGGRQVTISAITDGVVNTSGNAQAWSICDDSASLLLATGLLDAPQAVTAGNPFTLSSFTIGVPDPV